MTYLFCAALYYGVIVPVRAATRATKTLFLLAAVLVGGLGLGAFFYGFYVGFTGAM